MRRILTAAGWLCLSLVPLSAQAAEVPSGSAALSLDKLIEQLGDPLFRTREAAAKAIEMRGDAQLPALRSAAETSSSAEARRRLKTIVTEIERRTALSPKWVTVKCKDKPIVEVIADIAKQTGYVLQYQGGGPGRSLSYDMEKVTFWHAMDRICTDVGMYVYHNENNGMQMYHQDTVWPHVAHNGPFKVTANNLHYSKSVTLGGLPRNPPPNQQRSENLQFSFNIMSEPKLPIMQVISPRVIEAVDEFGNIMALPSNPHESNYGNGGYKTYNHSLYVPLAWPNKEARTIKRLRVSIPLTVLSAQKPDIVVEDILKAKDKKYTGQLTDLHVLEVKEIKPRYEIKLSVKNTAPDAAQNYNWTNSVHQRLELYDAKGNKYWPQGYNWENSQTGNVQATFMFGNNGNATLGPPAKLVYVKWETIMHQVEVEFKDLPLP